MIFLQVDFRANHTQPLDLERAKKTKDISGLKCLEQFEKFNRAGLWAKMFMASLIGMGDWFSTKCKLTWRLKGSTAFFGSDNDGLPERLDGITFSKWRNESLKAYGNAIVPQVAFELFRAVGVLNAKTLHETSL